jgi:hypothetical protein
MPLYEYSCSDSNCAFVTERLRRYDERESDIKCIKCGLNASYDGLCAAVGIVPAQFGVVMEDGTRVAGNIGSKRR